MRTGMRLGEIGARKSQSSSDKRPALDRAKAEADSPKFPSKWLLKTMSNAKKIQLIALFSGFPALVSRSREDTEISIASYLQVLSGFDDEIVASACLALRKKPAQFAPSAGEVYTECEKRQLQARKAVEWERLGRPVVRFQLPPPSRRDWTEAQLADPNCIINGLWEPYVTRPAINGMLAEYGYLTPAEAARAKEMQDKPKPRPRYSEAAE